MQQANVIVGTVPIEIVVDRERFVVTEGMRLYARTGGSGNVYFGLWAGPGVPPAGFFSPTTSNVNPVAVGPQNPTIIPADVFSRGQRVFIVADQAGQSVDWAVT